MIGNGLQGTLLSLRATSAGFDITTTGIVMSMYYVGYVAGSIYAPKMLMRVGHIRVFAALASLASATVLLHYVFVDPVTWGLTRVVTGFAYAGLYVVIESWLNGMATNATRGKILSIYMFL
ncbi:MAG: YbfB/YjiJ family MFS transporter, partial [Alphaproteobacteria bacterium]|nr:YbfB/YjiJ family MFS transporter [Alphaproteobacteria bacterium]